MSCWRAGSTGFVGETCRLAHAWTAATALALWRACTVGARGLELAAAVFTGWAVAAIGPVATVAAWSAASAAAAMA